MRHLATIRKILELNPIPEADAIEVATVDGWKVVVKKGEFTVGDLCVYFEIDSFLPIREEFEFLRKSSFKRMGEQEGFRLKTVKLRGQVSQGLLIPISDTLATDWSYTFFNAEHARSLQAGDDVTDLLGVQKYEPPVPAELAGQIRGNFPSFIRRTDQERCQNIVHDIFVENEDSRYEITMKVDGTSFTGYFNHGQEGVCGRNWELKTDDSNAFNTLVLMFTASGLRDALRELGENFAVQGELMGPGIQGNRERLTAHKLFVFDIYDIDNACYLAPHRRHEVLHKLYELGLKKDMVEHVPVIAMAESLEDLGVYGIDGLLKYAEGPSVVHPVREGLVFKRVDGDFSFKAISNDFLLREK